MSIKQRTAAAIRPLHDLRGNMLLARMAADDLDLIWPHLERVCLDRGQQLTQADTRIDYVHFPEGGIASIVSGCRTSERTEIGVVGRDGYTGTAALLGSDQSPYETFMQMGDAMALRIPVDILRDAMAVSASLQASLMRYAQVFMVQTAQSAVSNAHHRIEQRLARWLLMCHDRIDGDDIHLTHEFMSMMIAAQRTGVTMTLHVLEGDGLIRSQRGRVTILDRDGLEGLAGTAYGVPEAEYRRLLGPIGKGRAGLLGDAGRAEILL